MTPTAFEPGGAAQQDVVAGRGGRRARGGRGDRRFGGRIGLIVVAAEVDERQHSGHEHERGADDERAAEARRAAARRAGLRYVVRRRGVSRAGRVVFPFTRGSAGAVPVGSGGTASPPGTLRSGAATVAAQRVGGRVGQQQFARAGGVGLGLLAEQPVRDLAGARRRRQVGRKGREPAAGAGANRLLGHPEQV